MTIKDLLEILGGFLGGATVSAVVTFKITKAQYDRRTNTTQTGNRAGGDIVGGDSHKH